jgi:putative exosortase-associated protein (TIGR04073 family)
LGIIDNTYPELLASSDILCYKEIIFILSKKTPLPCLKGESLPMKSLFLAVIISVSILAPVPALATEAPKPESIAEKMSFKLVRGVTNIATSIAELPKQTYLTVKTHGAIGYAVGPLKGAEMTLYRCFIGITETLFFMVPQPGYYDPMIDPEFVWKGWENPKTESVKKDGETQQTPNTK